MRIPARIAAKAERNTAPLRVEISLCAYATSYSFRSSANQRRDTRCERIEGALDAARRAIAGRESDEMSPDVGRIAVRYRARRRRFVHGCAMAVSAVPTGHIERGERDDGHRGGTAAAGIGGEICIDEPEDALVALDGGVGVVV